MNSQSWLAQRLALLSMVITGLSCGEVSDGGLPAILLCDVATVECQSDIYESVAALLGADPTALPSVRIISPEQFRQEVLDGAAPYVLPVEGPLHRAHELMGFVFDEEGDVSEQQLAHWVRTSTGYYWSGAVTIIDREYDPGVAQYLLAHEYVHLIQERQFGSIDWAGLPTSDDLLAQRSLSEGDAELFAYDWYYRMEGVEPDEINWGYVLSQLREDLYELAANRDETLFASVNRFPYIAGMGLMRRAVAREGLAARRALFESPPGTSYDILHGGFPSVLEFPFEVESFEFAVKPPAEGFNLMETDRLGSWYLHTFLRRLGQEADSMTAEGWVGEANYSVSVDAGSTQVTPQRDWLGDRLSIFEKDGEIAAAWHIRHKDLSVYSEVDVIAQLVRNSPAPVAWTARRVSANEIVLLFAENEDTLAAWQESPASRSAGGVGTKAARERAVSMPGCVLRAPSPPR